MGELLPFAVPEMGKREIYKDARDAGRGYAVNSAFNVYVHVRANRESVWIMQVNSHEF